MFEQIDGAIRGGDIVRGFLSGAGLRVIRIEDSSGQLKGYGEHPHAPEALAFANQDVGAGGSNYEDVYGKTLPHYLTGSSMPTSALDQLILNGGKFRARAEGDDVVLEACDYNYNPEGTFSAATFDAALRLLEASSGNK